MFTLRFINGDYKTVVSAPRYDVSDSSNEGFVVITYPQTTSDSGGVEFHIRDGHRLAYDVCFVENQAGKTIDRIGSLKPNHKI